jgi:hypothetical protein
MRTGAQHVKSAQVFEEQPFSPFALQRGILRPREKCFSKPKVICKSAAGWRGGGVVGLVMELVVFGALGKGAEQRLGGSQSHHWQQILLTSCGLMPVWATG